MKEGKTGRKGETKEGKTGKKEERKGESDTE